MGLAFRLAVGVVPAMAPAVLGAILRIPSLAAKDAVAVRAAVLPGDQYPLRLIDWPGVFLWHSRTLEGDNGYSNTSV